ncbi:MAG: c-type cytochrome, partial [Prochlorococcus sp.]|nr:c-type cytochrome [Prochlorococcus sp.]
MILPQLLRGVALIRAVGLAVIIPLACLLIDSSIAVSSEPAFASEPALASEAALASEPVTGQELFQQHCVGCHLNGGNIIRRGRTLKLAALERNQINNQEAIARIARDGIGQMSGY